MVCLTGNVRHRSHRNVDKRYARDTEVQLALRYCALAARHRVKVTIFITGKACIEDRNGVSDLGGQANAELGGHTFCAFKSVRHWRLSSLGGSALGSASRQRRDIERTIAAIQSVTGKRITAWRNPASLYDVRTYRLLGAYGIRLVSDRITEHTTAMERVSQELLSLPINTLPDHEQLLHGKYTEGRSRAAALQGRRTIQEWRETVEHQVRRIEQLGGIATIVAHPLCMDTADHMHEFEHSASFWHIPKPGGYRKRVRTVPEYSSWQLSGQEDE